MTKVLAHRGRCGSAPDNTIAAFEEALAAGADGIECDVRMSGDGQLIIHHDPVLAELGAPLVRLSYSEICARRPVPLLDEVLEHFAGKCLLNLEIKEPGLDHKLLPRLAGLDQIVLSSFSDRILAQLASAPQPRGLLVGVGLDSLFPWPALGQAHSQRLIVHRRRLRWLLPQASRRGYELWAWDVNGRRDLTWALSDARISAVITDQPALAVGLRQQLQDQA